jgi:hypothetical protein
MDIDRFLRNQNGQLQMQLLQMPTSMNSNKISSDDNLRQEKLDLYLGIGHGLSDPFNLFINVTDILEKRDLIYFFSYSMGAKKVIVWGTYYVPDDKIEIEAGCRYNSWRYISYANIWKEMDYRIYDVLFKNKFTSLIDKYLDKSVIFNEINNETDLKAWKYMLAYFDDNISEDDFVFLFDRLNISELSYNYEHYINGESPLLDFYDLLGITDLTEDDELVDIIHDVKKSISDYENKLNYIDDRSPNEIKSIVMRITKLFLDNIMRSKYVGSELIKQLPICPQNLNDCHPDDLEDERNECSIFTYGRVSFNKKDNRYGSVQYEDDLT